MTLKSLVRAKVIYRNRYHLQRWLLILCCRIVKRVACTFCFLDLDSFEWNCVILHWSWTITLFWWTLLFYRHCLVIFRCSIKILISLRDIFSLILMLHCWTVTLRRGHCIIKISLNIFWINICLTAFCFNKPCTRWINFINFNRNLLSDILTWFRFSSIHQTRVI